MSIHPPFHGLLLGAFVGDALALDTHYLLDPQALQSRFQRLDGFQTPTAGPHQGKLAGDFTHLGDQMLLLQRSLSTHGGHFDAGHFAADWRAFWSDPECLSHRDEATRLTLASLSAGRFPLEAGSTSGQFGGLVRGLPLLAAGMMRGDAEEALITALKLQTRLTHTAQELLDTAGFMGRLFAGLAAGLELDISLDGALGDSSQFVRDWGGRAESPSVANLSTLDAVAKLGQGGDLHEALPASLLLLRRNAGSYSDAMRYNLLAGGDSAARGIFIGAVLGYLHGPDAVPSEWRQALRQVIPVLCGSAQHASTGNARPAPRAC